MPKVVHIDAESTSTYAIDQPGAIYLLDQWVQISTSSPPAIIVMGSAPSTTLRIAGRAVAEGAAIEIYAPDTVLAVEKSGFITGIGIDVTGRVDVENHGTISPASVTGIYFNAMSGRIVNTGDVRMRHHWR